MKTERTIGCGKTSFKRQSEYQMKPNAIRLFIKFIHELKPNVHLRFGDN